MTLRPAGHPVFPFSPFSVYLLFQSMDRVHYSIFTNIGFAINSMQKAAMRPKQPAIMRHGSLLHGAPGLQCRVQDLTSISVFPIHFSIRILESCVICQENHRHRALSGILSRRDVGEPGTCSGPFDSSRRLKYSGQEDNGFAEQRNIKCVCGCRISSRHNELPFQNRRDPRPSGLEPESVPFEPRHHHAQRLQRNRKLQGS